MRIRGLQRIHDGLSYTQEQLLDFLPNEYEVTKEMLPKNCKTRLVVALPLITKMCKSLPDIEIRKKKFYKLYTVRRV